jgi:hypothetical protein
MKLINNINGKDTTMKELTMHFAPYCEDINMPKQYDINLSKLMKKYKYKFDYKNCYITFYIDIKE